MEKRLPEQRRSTTADVDMATNACVGQQLGSPGHCRVIMLSPEGFNGMACSLGIGYHVLLNSGPRVCRCETEPTMSHLPLGKGFCGERKVNHSGAWQLQNMFDMSRPQDCKA